MSRSHRVDIFLILYLTAVVGFVVVSRDRERRDAAIAERIDRIVADFIPPLPLAVEVDTFVHYVAAEADTLVPPEAVFDARVLAGDIGLEDDLVMRVHTVSRDGMLQSPGCVTLGARAAVGSRSADLIAIPVRARFPRTGLWEITVRGTATRLHRHGGTLEYRGREVDTTLVPTHVLAQLETRLAVLRVRVIDTTSSSTRTGDPLFLRPESGTLTTAAGRRARMKLTLGPAWTRPELRVVSGGGTVQRIRASVLGDTWEWTGPTAEGSTEVLLEGTAHRAAQGKDIVRAGFRVIGIRPELRHSHAGIQYAGEKLSVDLRVAGLDDSTRYAWKLFEGAGRDSSLKKQGRGTRVFYQIPNSFAGKTLRVEATYDGTPYRFEDLVTHTAGPSVFKFDVQQPPLHLGFDPPPDVASTFNFVIKASRYSDPAEAGKQFIRSLAGVRIRVQRENGTMLEPQGMSSSSSGIDFKLPQSAQYSPAGERMVFHISVEDAHITRTVVVRADARRR